VLIQFELRDVHTQYHMEGSISSLVSALWNMTDSQNWKEGKYAFRQASKSRITVFTRVIHAFNKYLKNYRYNQIYLRKIVSSHKSRNLNLDTKFWLKKCVNYASKYGSFLWNLRRSSAQQWHNQARTANSLNSMQVITHCTAYSSDSQPLWDRGPVNYFFIRRGPGPNKFTRK
jgi:hypothetical protein